MMTDGFEIVFSEDAAKMPVVERRPLTRDTTSEAIDAETQKSIDRMYDDLLKVQDTRREGVDDEFLPMDETCLAELNRERESARVTLAVVDGLIDKVEAAKKTR